MRDLSYYAILTIKYICLLAVFVSGSSFSLVKSLQLWLRHWVTLINSKTFINRKIMVRFLTPHFPKVLAYIFGSSANNLGFTGCDVDMYLDLGVYPWDPRYTKGIVGLTLLSYYLTFTPWRKILAFSSFIPLISFSSARLLTTYVFSRGT